MPRRNRNAGPDRRHSHSAGYGVSAKFPAELAPNRQPEVDDETAETEESGE